MKPVIHVYYHYVNTVNSEKQPGGGTVGKCQFQFKLPGTVNSRSRLLKVTHTS